MSGDIVRWTARRLPGVDEAIRRELVESAGAKADRGGRLDRALVLDRPGCQVTWQRPPAVGGGRSGAPIGVPAASDEQPARDGVSG
jgi:hypothetical protein